MRPHPAARHFHQRVGDEGIVAAEVEPEKTRRRFRTLDDEEMHGRSNILRKETIAQAALQRLTARGAPPFHRAMKACLRSVLPVLLALGSLLTSAFADLEIRLARYGNTAKFRDVRHIVNAYVRSNTLSFPVNPRSMGGTMNPRGDDYLYIEYIANGRDYKGSAADGGIFTFQGIAGVRPPINLPILRPPVPTASPLRVVNRSGSLVRVYSVDRFGRWAWAENLASGSSFAAHAQVGQDWVVTDPRNQVLEQVRIRAGENTVILNPRFVAPGPGQLGRVRFENTSRRSLYLYSLDRWGGWNWTASLEPFGAYETSTRPGEEWVATDRANRVVEQVRIAPGMNRVTLN